MVSLKDIAAACGVSVATVSKALNNQSDVSEARKAVIRKKADEMGYFPNLAARALKTNTMHDIGILFSDEHNSGLTHPYFSQVLEGLKIRAEHKGYDITFISTDFGQRKMSYLEHCRYRNVDGVVIACVDFDQPQVLELIRSDLPVVTIDHVFDKCATISSNNVKGMQELTEYVIRMGHERIAFIHGRPSSVTNERLASFYRTMEEHGIEVNEEYIMEAPYLDDEASADCTRKFLSMKKRPTCILYPDDLSCIGGMNVIRSEDLSIPGDISVAGYDGVPISQIVSPKITTFRQNMQGIGRAAADKIVELIERPKTALKDNMVIDGALSEGASVARIYRS